MSEVYNGNRGGKRGGRSNDRGGRGRGRGGRGGKKQNNEYAPKVEKVEKLKEPEVVTKKIELNADDWKNMFAGMNGENYDKQVEDEKKAKEEAQQKEAQEEKQRKEEEEQQKIKEENERKEAEKEKEKQTKIKENQKSESAENKKENEENEKKDEEKPKTKKTNVVVPPKDFDLNNLENLWVDSGKVDKNKKQKVYAPILLKNQSKKLNNQDINLSLTNDLQFSMTHFDKINKGLANTNINCFMNVTLQSLIACPAFFNMLTAISQSKDHFDTIIKGREVLMKCIELSRHFNPEVNLKSRDVNYKRNTVDAQQIFYKELETFNPDRIQADSAEFMSYLLDLLHEELKDIYVPQEQKQKPQKEESKSEREVVWNETGSSNQVISFQNQGNQIEQSIIRDIFGGVIRTDFNVDGNRRHSVTFDPHFVINLDIQYDECTIEECLDEYFKPNKVEGYKQNNKVVRAHHQPLFEKLPNTLIINLKRFVYTDRLIKKKEHVFFEESLTIQDNHVSPQLQLGIFKKASQAGSSRKYRLFSIIEHIGTQATKGHYVCYTLDSNNDWIKFNDTKCQVRDINQIMNECQVYMLMYELIQDE